VKSSCSRFSLSAQLDPASPWPGLDAFEEHGRHYFHGRDAEAAELLRCVIDAPVTVLFGKSGFGKTSLLKAGLFPRLREKHFLPVHTRFDIRPAAPPLIDQLRDDLRAEIEREHVDAPAFGEGESLWEYLHRAGLDLWSVQNYQLTPVLVLDQFEEVFTLGRRLPDEIERFKVDFGDLAENRIPVAVAARLGADAASAERLNLRAMSYKLVVTLREDFLPHLEGWRRVVPALGRVRVRLLAMRPAQALSAVYDTAPQLMDEPLARRIVKFVAASQIGAAIARADSTSPESPGEGGLGGEIEPALLSLFCRELNERRKRQKKARFDEQLLEGAQESIIAGYYRSCVEDLPDSVSRFIETELITEKGFRNSYAKDDAVPHHLAQEELDRLINRRLVRLEERYGTVRVELTHDLVTRAVVERRDWRRGEEERATLAQRAAEERRALEAQTLKQRRRVRALAGFALVCLAFAAVAAWQWWEAARARTLAQATKRTALSAKLVADARAEQGRRLDLSLLLATAAWAAKATPEARSVLLSGILARPSLRGMFHARSGVQAVAFSPDGKILASAGGDRTVTLWDVARRVPVGEPLAGHQDVIRSVAFSPDGRILASGGGDGSVILWSVARRAPLGGPLAGHDDAVWSVAFSPDGTTLASAGGRLILWDVARRVPLGGPLVGHKGGVSSVAFSPDGKMLASASGDRTIILWDVARRAPLGNPLAGHRDVVRSVAFSPDGKILASGGGERVITLWDVARRSRVGPPLVGHNDVVSSVAFSPDGKILASAGGRAIILWDVARRAPLREPLAGHSDGILSVAFSPDGEMLASASGGRTVVLWDVVRRTPLGTALAGHNGDISSIAFSPDGKILASGSWDGTVILWDVARHRPLGKPLRGHNGHVSSVAFSPDGKTLACGGGDHTVTLWEVARRTRLGEPLGHTDGVLGVAFSPDGKLLAAASRDLVLWDVARHPPLGKPLTGHRDGVLSVAFRPDGKILAAGSWDGTVILWDMVRHVPLGEPLAGHRNWVLSIAFSPDGRTLASGGRDGTIVLWDAIRHVPLGEPLGGHKGEVSSVAFSPDGKLLAAGGQDRTVMLWDVASRTPLGESLAGHTGSVLGVAFSPDARIVASGSGDDTVILWDVDPDSWRRRSCSVASRNLTCDEWRRHLLDEPYGKLCPELPGPERCEPHQGAS
jgi:WD40 repeat protein